MLFAGNLTKHPCFDEMRASGERIPRSWRALDEYRPDHERDTFWVGVYPGMTDEMIDYMAKVLIEAAETAGKEA